jgi:ketosteroid isomerase-like protein
MEVHHSRTPLRAALAVAALAAALAAAPARAQVGLIPDNSNMTPELARVRIEAMQGATETLNAWSTAWARDDVRALMRLYQKDALVVLPTSSAPSQGEQAIAQALQASLPALGRIELGTVDVAVDDHLLYLYQKFVVEPGTAAGGGATGSGVTGTATLVMQREGSRWKIRAQIFSPEVVQSAIAPTASPAQAAADGDSH